MYIEFPTESYPRQRSADWPCEVLSLLGLETSNGEQGRKDNPRDGGNLIKVVVIPTIRRHCQFASYLTTGHLDKPTSCSGHQSCGIRDQQSNHYAQRHVLLGNCIQLRRNRSAARYPCFLLEGCAYGSSDGHYNRQRFVQRPIQESSWTMKAVGMILA
jgi:hypothetical protein